MRGIVLAGGAGSRLFPATLVVGKQLLPVWDKPMVYYPLSTLMLAGIRDILIVSTPRDLPAFRELLGDGDRWGIRLSYRVQPEPQGVADALRLGADFIGDQPVCLVLGDNILHGQGLASALRRAARLEAGAVIFTYRVQDPERYAVVRFDASGAPIAIVEKPTEHVSSYAVPGIYFYAPDVVSIARSLTPSDRGELEIADVNQAYLDRGLLRVEHLGRGTAWLDTGTHASLLDAARFIETLEARQGLKVGCPEEIAWRMGFIDDGGLRALAAPLDASGYGDYLRRLLDDPPGHPAADPEPES